MANITWPLHNKLLEPLRCLSIKFRLSGVRELRFLDSFWNGLIGLDCISFELHNELRITIREFIMAQTSMLHVRVDEKLKADAAEKLASFGLTISDAVRILLTRVTKEGGLPVGLTADPEAHDAWFRDKVKKALADSEQTVPHQQVMDEVQALIDRKRRSA